METTGNSQHSAKGHDINYMIESLNHFQKPNHTFTHTPYHLYPVFCTCQQGNKNTKRSFSRKENAVRVGHCSFFVNYGWRSFRSSCSRMPFCTIK